MRSGDGSPGVYGDIVTKIIVITGWDRSGSTILASALGSIDGVVAMGEVTNLWERGFGQDLLCSCGEPFSACSFWQPVASGAFGGDIASVAKRAELAMTRLGGTTLARRQLRGSAGTLEGSEPYAALLSRVYAAGASVSGASVIVDSSKKPWHTAVAMGLDDFDVYVLHVLRDPRGVAFSFQKQVAYDGGDQEMARHSPTFSSLAWLYRNWLTESEWGEHPHYLRTRYEDFVLEPRQTLLDIFAMIEEDLDLPLTTENDLLLKPSHNISGNPARFNTGTIELRLDDAWRSELPAGIRRYVSALTTVQRRKYGYR